MGLIVVLLIAIIVILLGGGHLVLWAAGGLALVLLLIVVVAVPSIAVVKGVELVDWYRTRNRAELQRHFRRTMGLLWGLGAVLILFLPSIVVSSSFIGPIVIGFVGWFALWYTGSWLMDRFNKRKHRTES